MLEFSSTVLPAASPYPIVAPFILRDDLYKIFVWPNCLHEANSGINGLHPIFSPKLTFDGSKVTPSLCIISLMTLHLKLLPPSPPPPS